MSRIYLNSISFYYLRSRLSFLFQYTPRLYALYYFPIHFAAFDEPFKFLGIRQSIKRSIQFFLINAVQLYLNRVQPDKETSQRGMHAPVSSKDRYLKALCTVR